MPAEKAFSITEIVRLLRNYDFSKQRRLSFEYIVFKGVNDSLLYAKKGVVEIIAGAGLPYQFDSFSCYSGS